MPKRRKTNKSEPLTPAKKVYADILIPRLVFILSTLALLLFGFVMVFSASNVEAINNGQSPYYYLIRQILFGGLGIACALLIWRKILFARWRSVWLWAILGGLFFLMILTLFLGKDVLGARRWLNLGFVSIQPAEYVKIVLVLLVAKYICDYYNSHISLGRCVLIAGGITILLLFFILVAQSDLGTTIICVIGVLAVMYVSGVKTPVIVAISLTCIVLACLFIIASGYRSNRMIFLDPYNDGAGGYGAGYQLIRSYYAFSQGGLSGVGLGNSFEKYQYLPEAETDFIFAIVGEELGFIGCIFVIALFVVFLISGLMIAVKSKSRFAASIASAFVIMIVFQAFLNIMCVIGFAPTTGKPLPFISYGGSSLIASLIMVGFILAASESEALPDEYTKKRREFKVGTPLFNAKINQAETQTKKLVKNSSVKAKVTKRSSKKNIIPNVPSPTKGVKKIPQMSAPKFIEANKKKKNVSNKNIVKKRPSVKQAGSSYAYRRANLEPSFKARVRKTSNSAKSTSKNSVRPSVANQRIKGRK